jgi:hypothetical protein
LYKLYNAIYLFFETFIQLTLQFMYDEFVEDYEPTKADSYRKKVRIACHMFIKKVYLFMAFSSFHIYTQKNNFESKNQLGGFGWRRSTN